MLHQQQPNETLIQDLLKLAKTAEQHMQGSIDKLTVLAERLEPYTQGKQKYFSRTRVN